MTKSIDEITAELNNFVGNPIQDLQISTASKLFDPSLLEKVSHGLVLPPSLRNSLAEMAHQAAEQERSLAEIAALADLTVAEVVDFYQTHPYSLEFIKAALQAGAKLNEEDIKRTMEERAGYRFVSYDRPDQLNEIISAGAFGKQDHTFTVTLPSNDRREVKAAYMEVDGATLYFEDEDRETILAFGPGHWIWAERVEEDE